MGLGFTFDDTETEGNANSISDMRRLVELNPRNAERIFPYIGGDEVNNSPLQQPHRFVIDFFDRSLEEAEKWPDLMKIVKQKVKPERDLQKRAALRERWWQYAEKRPGMYNAIKSLPRILVTGQTAKYRTFVFLPTGLVFDQKLVVVTASAWGYFAVLQARIHEIWALFLGSTLEDRPVYTPTDCFETFPFPTDFEMLPTLERTGREHYEYRAALMVKNDQGLTETYNRFHDPEERHPEILRLRELHSEMDRTVLDAYGWTDIQPRCEFLLDYEDEEDEENSRPHRRKKPWRYRWPDEIRDETLARLLELNRVRAEEEQLSGAAAEANSKSAANRKPRKGKKKVSVETGSLLDSLPEKGQS